MEKIKMKNNHITWLGRYEGYLRTIARGVRDNNPKCIECAAKLFDLMLPEGAKVVPMPSHFGTSVQMLSVARQLKRRRKDIRVLDFLRCEPHEANYSQKKYTTPAPIKMFFDEEELCGECVNYGADMFVIDNVVCTGVTASAALEVLPDATVLALAMSSWR